MGSIALRRCDSRVFLRARRAWRLRRNGIYGHFSLPGSYSVALRYLVMPSKKKPFAKLDRGFLLSPGHRPLYVAMADVRADRFAKGLRTSACAYETSGRDGRGLMQRQGTRWHSSNHQKLSANDERIALGVSSETTRTDRKLESSDIHSQSSVSQASPASAGPLAAASHASSQPWS